METDSGKYNENSELGGAGAEAFTFTTTIDKNQMNSDNNEMQMNGDSDGVIKDDLEKESKKKLEAEGSDEVKEPTVTCLYCDHQFEVFDREVLGMHLTIVHFVTNNLDDLVEFTFNNIHGSEGTTLLYSWAPVFFQIDPSLWNINIFSLGPANEEDRLECISPEPLATIKPLPEPEDLSDIESEDEDKEASFHSDEDSKTTKEGKVENENGDKKDDAEEDIKNKEDKDVEMTEVVTKPKAEVTNDVDAVSDLSLSEDEKDEDDIIVLDETKEEEPPTTSATAATIASTTTSTTTCTKCDVPHMGGRCSYVLKSSSDTNSRKSPHDNRPKRVRTLPSELYHNPDNIDSQRRHRHRSRSPVAPPRRVAPPAPSPPGYGDRRERRDRSPYEDRRDRCCMLCGDTGHIVKDCPELFCHKCNTRGHFAKECDNVVTSGYSTGSAGQAGQYQYNPFSQMAGLQQQANMAAANYPAAYSTPNPTPFNPAHPTSTPYNQVTDHLPNNYTESLHSLQPLQAYMSTKMAALPGQPYPRNYIDLLISNVGKMLAQANLGLR